jgi:DUF4097 and DUF4098 domain-containing protein YvlB
MAKVYNMTSSNGNKIANQFEIENDDGSITFQSYNSVIAKKHKGKITLDSTYWDYSRTTGKYRNMFLNETVNETRQKIASGEYTLANLN